MAASTANAGSVPGDEDFLSDRSRDLVLVNAWVSPEHLNTLVVRPYSQALAEKLQPLARAVLDLRESLNAARSQTQELTPIWRMLSGLSAIAAMHFVYNNMRGGQPDGWAAQAKQLSDQANSLLAKCAESAAFKGSDGDLCQVHVVAVNKALHRAMHKQVMDIDNGLKDGELIAAYDALVKNVAGNPNILDEINAVNLILAEAHELVALSRSFLDPKHSATSKADEMGKVIDALMAKPPKDIRSNPGTNTVLDVGLTSSSRSFLANTATTAGLATPAVGPDGLLLKLVILYLHRKIPAAHKDPVEANRLRRAIIPFIEEFLGIEASGSNRFETLFTKSHEHVAARSRLASARARGATSEADLDALEKEASLASGAVDKEMLRIKDKVLGEELHLHDGPLANSALAFLSAIQIVDAIASFTEAQSTAEKFKSGFDTAAGLGTLATTAPAVYVRLACVDGTSAWLEGASNFALRTSLKYVTPVAGLGSGVAQMVSAAGEQDWGEGTVGLLNTASGGLMLWYAAFPATSWVPVAGQAVALLAFATGLTIALMKEGELMTQKYVNAAIKKLKESPWSHGDPEDLGSLAKILDIKEELERLESTLKGLSFWPIPVPDGVNAEELIRGLTYYTGDERIAKQMVLRS